MHDAALVGSAKRLGTLQSNFEKLFQRHGPAQALAQVFSFDVFHDQEYFALLLEHVVNRGNMRINEARDALGFLLEAAAISGISPQAGGETL